MNVLGFDTSLASDTPIGVLLANEEYINFDIHIRLSQEQKLLAGIDSALTLGGISVQDLGLIGIGVGPGSFTGVRIGVTTARTLAWSQNIPIIPISSLELMARSIPDYLLTNHPLVVPVLDARMKRVFSAAFFDGKRVMDDTDIEPELLTTWLEKRPEKSIILLGDGLIRFSDKFNTIPGKNIIHLPDFRISGKTICDTAIQYYNEHGAPSLEQAFPVYLRKSEAENQLDKKNSGG